MHWGHDMNINEYAQTWLNETDIEDVPAMDDWVVVGGCDVNIIGSDYTKDAPKDGVVVVVYSMDDADDDRLATMQDPIDRFVLLHKHNID
jgi:hypothetical protein